MRKNAQDAENALHPVQKALSDNQRKSKVVSKNSATVWATASVSVEGLFLLKKDIQSNSTGKSESQPKNRTCQSTASSAAQEKTPTTSCPSDTIWRACGFVLDAFHV